MKPRVPTVTTPVNSGLDLLPAELLNHVLTFLPRASIGNARLTCRAWSAACDAALARLETAQSYAILDLERLVARFRALTDLDVSGEAFSQLADWELQALGGLPCLSRLKLCGWDSLRLQQRRMDSGSLLCQLRGLRCLAALNLSEFGLLPERSGAAAVGLPLLTQLTLSGAEMAALPAWVAQLPRLQQLTIERSYPLASLPSTLSRVTSLTRLTLMYCGTLAELPACLGSLTGLEQLEVAGCPALKCLPDSLGALSRLRSLKLVHLSQLGSVPGSVGDLSALQSLHLEDLQALPSLPAALKRLTGLQLLSIRCRWLSGVALCIGLLGALRSLALGIDEGELRQLGAAFAHLTSLQHLELEVYGGGSPGYGVPHDWGGGGAAAPMCLGRLTALQQLSVLGSLRSSRALALHFGGLGRLQALHVRCLAQLCGCVGGLGRLGSLELDQGCAAALPESLGKLGRLRRLSVTAYDRLTRLPDSLGALSELQQLRLARCYSLCSLPKSVGQLPSLQLLAIKECPALVALPEHCGMMTQLQRLELEDVGLTQLPPSCCTLPALRSISLRGCRKIAELPAALGGLPMLESLLLEKCSRLASLPESLGRRPGVLQRLRIRECRSLKRLSLALSQQLGAIADLQLDFELKQWFSEVICWHPVPPVRQ